MATHVKHCTSSYTRDSTLLILPKRCWPSAGTALHRMSWWKIDANSPNNHNDIKEKITVNIISEQAQISCIRCQLALLPGVGV